MDLFLQLLKIVYHANINYIKQTMWNILLYTFKQALCFCFLHSQMFLGDEWRYFKYLTLSTVSIICLVVIYTPSYHLAPPKQGMIHNLNFFVWNCIISAKSYCYLKGQYCFSRTLTDSWFYSFPGSKFAETI